MYEDRKCEYCAEQFAKNDDIVVCPDCGAPYHRACWEAHGVCAHADEHGMRSVAEQAAGTSEKETAQEEDFVEKIKTQILSEKAQPADKRRYCECCGAKLIDGSEYCVMCSHKQGDPINKNRRRNQGKDPLGGLEPDTEIAGQKACDMALLVRNNAEKLLPRLKRTDERKVKIGWSWLAFFFGYLYLFFRKLYKYGIIVILAEVMLFNVMNFVLGDPITATTKAVSEIYAEYGLESGGTALTSLTQEQYDQFITQANKELVESGLAGKVYAVLGISLLVSNTACALLFDYLYLKHCRETILRMKRSAEILGDMSAQDYRLNLLVRGGVSIFGLVLGYCSWFFVGQMVAYLLELFSNL